MDPVQKNVLIVAHEHAAPGMLAEMLRVKGLRALKMQDGTRLGSMQLIQAIDQAIRNPGTR